LKHFSLAKEQYAKEQAIGFATYIGRFYHRVSVDKYTSNAQYIDAKTNPQKPIFYTTEQVYEQWKGDKK